MTTATMIGIGAFCMTGAIFPYIPDQPKMAAWQAFCAGILVACFIAELSK